MLIDLAKEIGVCQQFLLPVVTWDSLVYRRVAELFLFDFEISGIHLDEDKVSGSDPPCSTDLELLSLVLQPLCVA